MLQRPQRDGMARRGIKRDGVELGAYGGIKRGNHFSFFGGAIFTVGLYTFSLAVVVYSYNVLGYTVLFQPPSLYWPPNYCRTKSCASFIGRCKRKLDV